MSGGLLMVLLGSLVIAQVTKGQALQRLGILNPSSGGIIGQIGAVSTGVSIGLNPGTNPIPGLP